MSRSLIYSLWIVLWSLALGLLRAEDSPADFAKAIRPILAEKCIKCHGPDRQSGGLRLDRKANALQGGDSGAVIVPGKSAESILIELIQGTDPERRMPPEGELLSPEEVKSIQQWIDSGANWPKEFAESALRSTHWAFQPIVQPESPSIRNTDWVRSSVDPFILGRLEEAGIAPSPEAPRTTLFRRLCLDLTGLPPTPEQVHEYLSDGQGDAYERAVDRLLGSPHFGEHWGRHWLDLARYADSDGYEKDLPRPFAYRYRDWVIQAINEDVPFDRFSLEQLAGDLLPQPTTEQLVATGFHRNTLTNTEGGVDQEEFRVAATVNRVNTVGTVWLGLTLGCAQCHSHKYDPLSQREYYQLFSFFNSIREENIAAPSVRESVEYWERLHHWSKKDSELRVPGTGGSLALLAEHEKTKPASPATMAQVIRQHERSSKVLKRGDFLQPGEEVQSGVPACLNPLPEKRQQPGRLEFTQWLFEADNPLTARVAVNHIWLHLFGRGLVETPEDFGLQGSPASHPQLLDHLALEFRRKGWSRKSLIREIVLSATYRQSSRTREELREIDPKNILLARQNRFRLDGEVVRDIFLTASGLLDRRIGGPSVRPKLPSGVAELGYAGSVQWPESAAPDKYRRGLYIFFQRTVPYPMLSMFDAPDSNNACTRRERSSTPLQSLTLLNDPVFMECSVHLGNLSKQSEDRIQSIFLRILGRTPDAFELERLKLYENQCRSWASQHPDEVRKLVGDVEDAESMATSTLLARILFNLEETITRE